MEKPSEFTIEDRTFGANKPYIDLTPLNEWGKPIISHIGKEAWGSIEKFVANRAGGACELCGASPTTQGAMGRRANKFCVELRFSHDDHRKIATLRRLLHVCIPCNQAIHLRQTELVSKNMPPERSPLIGAIARLANFHSMTEAQVKEWLANELFAWKHRADIGYPENIDVDIIEDGTNRLWR